MTWTKWTDNEKTLLQAKYGKVPTDNIAQELNRSPKQVREAAKRFCKLKPHNKLEDYKDKLLELHKEGKSNPVIAKELKVPVTTIEFWLRNLQLSGNGWCKESLYQHRRAKIINWLMKSDPMKNKLIWKAIRAVCKKFPDSKIIEKLGGLNEIYSECIKEVLDKVHRFNSKKGKISTFIYSTVYYHTLVLFNFEGNVIKIGRRGNRDNKGVIKCKSLSDIEFLIPHKEIQSAYGEDEMQKLHQSLFRLREVDRNMLQDHYSGSFQINDLAKKYATSRSNYFYRLHNTIVELKAIYFGVGYVV